MPRLYCASCKTYYPDSDSFTVHLNVNGDGGCEMAFRRRKESDRETNTPASVRKKKRAMAFAKRRKTSEEVEAVLQRNEELNHQEKGDVFAFDKEHEEALRANSRTLYVHELRPGPSQRVKKTSVRVETVTDDVSNTTETPITACNTQNTAYVTDNYHRKDGNEARKEAPDFESLSQFQEYCERARVDNKGFDVDTEAAIELMDLMNKKGGSLTLFNAVMEWHLNNLTCTKATTAKALHKKLIARYNMDATAPYEIPVDLPFAKETIKVSCHDFLAQIIDLLTDPRISEDDYLWIDGDPDSVPPEEWTTVCDVNSGAAYRETVKRLIKDRPFTENGRERKILQICLYTDGCVTGQSNNMEIEVVKFTLGVLNAKARGRHYAWRNLGYVPTIVKGKKAAQKMLRNSTHLDSQNHAKDANYRRTKMRTWNGDKPTFGDSMADANVDILSQLKAQDYHCIMNAMFDGASKLQERGGFDWDQVTTKGTRHYNYLPVFFFFKVDGPAAAKVCLHYGPKTEKIQNICRMCCIRTKDTDKPYLDPPPERKSQTMISALIKANDDEGLKRISQHKCNNAFYKLQWALHNDYGIHGACPMEALHWIDLNMFGTTRECLFFQVGPTSALAALINTIATSYGEMLKHQSYKDMPRTTFSSGVQDGKVMAHEMTGVMILLLLTLRSTKGRNALLNQARGEKKLNFTTLMDVCSWIGVLERQLEFERWMKKDEMDVSLLKDRCPLKLSEFMAQIKAVENREEGMGFKTITFHQMKHLHECILDFGVPEIFNTSTNEADHKPDKKTSQRTTRHHDEFESEMAVKTHERQAVELAVEELSGCKRWHYFRGFFDHSDRIDLGNVSEEFDPILGGTRTKFWMQGDSIEEKVTTRMKDKDKFEYDKGTCDEIHALLNEVSDQLSFFYTYTEYKVYDTRIETHRQIYRAIPYCTGMPWNDWAMFDLSQPHNPKYRDFVPCQLKCFVDLTELPIGSTDIQPGMYALVDVAYRNPDPDEQGMSDLIEPWIKLPSNVHGLSQKFHKMELVNLNRLLSPAILVPDLENKNPRAYMRLVPRSEWADYFEDWLKLDHKKEYEDDESTDEADEDEEVVEEE